jgi:hypothetical protein
MLFLEKKLKKNNKILEISMQELCILNKPRRIYRKEVIPREKSWKMQLKSDVNDGKIEPKFREKVQITPKKGRYFIKKGGKLRGKTAYWAIESIKSDGFPPWNFLNGLYKCCLEEKPASFASASMV